MTKLNPYLTLPGTATEAIELYKKVFKVQPTTVQKFKDMPSQKGMPTPSPKVANALSMLDFKLAMTCS